MIEMKVPSPGESITEVTISRWLVEDGAYVEKDQPLAEIESDKATLELNAEDSGQVKILVKEGETVKVGSVVCWIDTEKKGERKVVPQKDAAAAEPGQEAKKEEKKSGSVKEAVAAKSEADIKKQTLEGDGEELKVSPVAKEIIRQNSLEAARLKGTGTGGKITKADVVAFMSGGFDTGVANGWGGSRKEERKKMSSLRKKLSQRLVSVKNQTAMLTTFNEVDMSAVVNLRNKYKDKFKEKHGIGLGFMSFFTKAVTEALHLYPAVNAAIDGEEIIYYDYADVGIAVSAPKGLMVPVLRNAEKMSLAEIEKNIRDLAAKARDGKITIDEMTGGTFTITNGGVFGSMLSTPIINPPQSAILGMHNIVERPVAVNGKVEIRPVMYVALSYDHRIIDGRESVGFLLKIKEMIENPSRMLFGAKDPEEVLLGL